MKLGRQGAKGKEGEPGEPGGSGGPGGTGGKGGEGGGKGGEGGKGGRVSVASRGTWVIVAGFVVALGVGVWLNRNQIDNLERLRHDREVVTCRNAAKAQAVAREILRIRIESTPDDPAVPRYRVLLKQLPPIDCTDPTGSG